mmetsp:Transcript_47947/g.91664  ORF Transcript_47947/g.91664 Transcript_47947/m.91664 type:complete len:281 (+) Transcript_47947:48-890(+)
MNLNINVCNARDQEDRSRQDKCNESILVYVEGHKNHVNSVIQELWTKSCLVSYSALLFNFYSLLERTIVGFCQIILVGAETLFSVVLILPIIREWFLFFKFMCDKVHHQPLRDFFFEIVLFLFLLQTQPLSFLKPLPLQLSKLASFLQGFLLSTSAASYLLLVFMTQFVQLLLRCIFLLFSCLQLEGGQRLGLASSLLLLARLLVREEAARLQLRAPSCFGLRLPGGLKGRRLRRLRLRENHQILLLSPHSLLVVVHRHNLLVLQRRSAAPETAQDTAQA